MKKQGILKKIFTYKVLLVAASLSLGSCIAEGMEDCLEPLRLLITTDHEEMVRARGDVASTGDRTTRTPIESWYEEIGDVNLYVFDENDNFVMRWTGPAYNFDPTAAEPTYEVPLGELGLPDGVYRMVTWTNHGDAYPQYNTSGTGHHGDFRMVSTIPTDRVMLEDFAHRHYGTITMVNLSPNAIRRTNVIEIAPTTHKVNFTVRVNGALGYTADDDFRVTVTDRNASYDFQNRFVDGEEDYYNVRDMVPAVSENGDDTRVPGMTPDVVASAVLMQIQDKTGTSLDINHTENGQTLEALWPTEDLVDLIKLVYSANGQGRVTEAEWDEFFEYRREFDIDITVLSRLTLELKINGWVYRLNRVEL